MFVFPTYRCVAKKGLFRDDDGFNAIVAAPLEINAITNSLDNIREREPFFYCHSRKNSFYGAKASHDDGSPLSMDELAQLVRNIPVSGKTRRPYTRIGQSIPLVHNYRVQGSFIIRPDGLAEGRRRIIALRSPDCSIRDTSAIAELNSKYSRI